MYVKGISINKTSYKYHKKRYVGFGHFECSNVSSYVNSFYLRSLEYKHVTKQQIVSASAIIRKKMKKTGKFFIRVYPINVRMEKSSGVRMGKGKGGKIKDYTVFVKPGKIIFELCGVSKYVAEQIFFKCSHKLNVSTVITKFINFL